MARSRSEQHLGFCGISRLATPAGKDALRDLPRDSNEKVEILGIWVRALRIFTDTSLDKHGRIRSACQIVRQTIA